MDANIWGPHTWFFLHSVTFGYPIKPNESEKKSYYNLVMSLQNTLPCGECRNNFRHKLSELPLLPFLDSRKNFIRWMIEIHNRVNISIGKKPLNLDEVLNNYKNWYTNNSYLRESKWKTFVVILFVIQTSMLLYLLVTKRLSISLE